MAANAVNILVNADGSQAQGQFQKVSKAVAGVSLAVAGVGLALVKIGDDFTKSYNNIRAGTGATGAELEGLKQEFRDLAGRVPQDMDAVSTAIADVNTKMGLTGDDLENTTKKFLDMSRLMGTEVEPMIKTVSDSMGVFGVDVSETGQILDSLAMASQESGVPMEQLSSTMREFGPVMKNLGLNFHEATAMFSQLEGAGISITRVMPGLNASMRRLAESGVTDLRQALFDGMTDIQNATSEVEALNMATDLFGAEGAQRMKVAIQEGAVDIDAMASSLEAASGVLTEMNEGSLTSGERFDMMKDKAKLMLEPLAGMASAAGPFVVMLPAFISGVAALASSTMVASAATKAWTAIQAAFNLVMSANPVALIILGIVAAVTAAILIWKNWDTIVRVFWETWEKLDAWMSGHFGETWQWIKDIAVGVFTVWYEVIKGFIQFFKGDTDEALKSFAKAWEALKGVFSTFFGFIWDKFDELMTKLLGDKWDKFKEIIGNVVEAVKGYFSGLVEALGGMWDVIVGIFTGDTDLIISGFKAIVNGVVEMINSIVRLANTISFDLPDWLGGGSFGFNLPEIPRLAEGGIVNKPTLAMIGEAGPEAVVPLGQGGGGMGANITINIMGATYGFDDFENKVAEAIKDGVRRGGFQRIIN